MKPDIFTGFLQKCRESQKSALIVFMVLRLLIIACMFRQLVHGHYSNVLLCMLSLLIISVPTMLRSTLHICLPGPLEISIALFVFAAEILGEISNFYGNVPFWDTMLHIANGFLSASVGFSVVELLNQHCSQVHLSPLFIALVAFCFSMTIGVLWEFFEFGGDCLGYTDMQKDRIVQSISSVEFNEQRLNKAVTVDGIACTVLYDAQGNALMTIENGYLDIGLIDTMKDLMVNVIGALVFSVCGYFYLTRKQRIWRFVEKFIITRDRKKADEQPPSDAS